MPSLSMNNVHRKNERWNPVAENKSYLYVSCTGYFAYYWATSILLCRLVSIWYDMQIMEKDSIFLKDKMQPN
ncbi:hypothetical protein PR048_003346 [Dryococelus australis]|uniref:Transmembrane protein n=1 Tax=Dryococelus australis TaxID=614101 RepID=A0ABQ9IMV8_9NEOP|nr:hypothetical protein PR048_003346 [Dryococelus australis]